MKNTMRLRRSYVVVAVTAVVLAGVGCAGSEAMQEGVVENASDGPPPSDGLNSTVWSLVSAEYDAAVLSTYNAAWRAIENGLTDPGWTALTEQEGMTGMADLPPAVVLDVDETVLDNGAYQARLVVDGTSYSSESWLDWVLEERAAPVPGALEFTRKAHASGITIIYLTNRRGNMEEATRRNLHDLGFPIDPTFDVVLTRGEREEWRDGEKEGRRKYVADHYRVIAMFGDNLGDFVNIDGLSLDERNYEVDGRRSWWGSKWFMLPNPLYGSWESASFNDRYGLSDSERRSLKIALLKNISSR